MKRALILAALLLSACHGQARLPCLVTGTCTTIPPVPTPIPTCDRDVLCNCAVCLDGGPDARRLVGDPSAVCRATYFYACPTPTPAPTATPSPAPTATPTPVPEDVCPPPTIREWGVAGSCHAREERRWPDGVNRDSCLVDSTIHFFGAIACDSDHPFAVCCGRSWDNADGPMWTISVPYVQNRSNPWQVWVEARGQVTLRACPPQPFFTPDGIGVPVAYGGACGTRTLDFDKGVD